MKNKIHIIFLSLNTILFIWCIYNVVLLSNTDISEAQLIIEKTPNASAKAIDIFKSYEKSEQIEKLNEFISLFEKMSIHLEATKDTTLESVDALYEYTYAFLLISLFNTIVVIYLTKEKSA